MSDPEHTTPPAGQGQPPGGTTHTDQPGTEAAANRGTSAVSGDGAARLRNLWPLVVAVLIVCLAVLGMNLYWQSHQAEKSAQETPKGTASSKAALANAKRAGTSDDNARRLGAESDVSEIGDKKPSATVPAIEQDNAAPIPVQGQGQPQGQGQAAAPRSRFDAPTSFNAPGYGYPNAMPGQPAQGMPAKPATTVAGRAEYNVPQAPSFSSPTPYDKSALNLSTTRTTVALASMIGNRDFILAKGALIDCDLDTAINSTVPGMVRCTTTKDAYSDNGHVVLVGRGSTITGEYRSDVQNGQARIQIVWNRIKTPEGAIIEPASPASDNLGRGGVDGDVDNHWGERVGSAFLLSMIKDAIAYKTATNGNGSTTNLAYQNTTQSGEQMSSQILKQTISIPPTITRNQGTRVKIFLARDLDFSGVYTLKVTQ